MEHPQARYALTAWRWLAGIATALATLLGDLWHNLKLGLRLALLRRVALREFVANADQVALLFALLPVFYFLSDYIEQGAEGSFDYTALPVILFFDGLLLFLSYLIARMLGAPRSTLAFFLAFETISVWYGIAYLLLQLIFFQLPEDSITPVSTAWALIALYVWFALALAGAVLRSAAGAFPARLILSAALVVIVTASSWLFDDFSLWTTSSAPEAQAEVPGDPQIIQEAALEAQPRLLQQELEALAPQRPGVDDLYVVSVGGEADENVFMLEAEVTKELFDERFDTEGRSIALVNNDATVRQVPIATVSNLRRALSRIGALMDVERDVLLLYITTHGAEDHELSLNHYPLELQQLTPPLLKEVLAQSAIKWKILIISACFSGGYVNPLLDDHTLIVTASDATHPSFGCGVDSDFTYFGKAYVDHALRKTFSLTEAFELAKEEVRRRELADNEEHSNPQLFVGKAIAPKLQAMQQRWRSLSETQTAAAGPAKLTRGP